MSISVYTSCALNYLPKARVLAESLAAAEPGATLTLCLNDVPPPWLDLAAEPFERIWLPADLGYDRGWIFQHNVMELCTAVKGRALLRLIEEDAPDLAIYLDPDVMVFNPLSAIDGYLGDASIGLVPHILAPEESETGVELTELSVAAHGVYNLGHLVVRPDARGMAFARWWAARLDRHCFDDRARGLFTDQRWVDLAPAMFEGVKILKVPNLDVASWNLSQRTLRQNQPDDPASFTVDGWPLVTYHFSGTGPAGTHRRIREIFASGAGAVAEIERLYEAAIARHGQAQLEQRRPAFDAFDDGTPVTPAARRLYRGHAQLRQTFPDPYACPPGARSLRDWLREARPGAIAGLIVPAHRLATAYADLFDARFYLAAYPDAAEAVAAGDYRDALDHYERLGSRRLYDPNEFFVSSDYLDRALGSDPWPLAARAGRREGTLLWHYLTTGLPAGIEPVEFFDSRWYLAEHGDLAAAFRLGQISTPLAHFLHDGSGEGRDPGPHFRGTTYLESSPPARALASAGGTRGAFGALVRLGGVAGRVAV
ncbi:MAG TPA: hypothetical protein VMM59_03030 [Thermohalobaculum sp.]|nr:hypothetical protein [Thermohalobaculum sp.]